MISFAWTTPAVLAAYFQSDLGGKTETRRDWKPEHRERMAKLIGKPIPAYDRSARFGGRVIGEIVIDDIVWPEQSVDIPDSAWEAEGFGMLYAIGAEFRKGASAHMVWRYWRSTPDNQQTVVRFHIVSVSPYGHELWGRFREKHGARLRDRISLSDLERMPQ